VLTALDEVIALLKPCLPEVADRGKSAVTIDGVAEMLTAHAHPTSFPAQ